MVIKNKFVFLIILTLIFATVIPRNAISQNSQQQLNLLKYWHYRDRLQYFVVPGIAPGESQVATFRNEYANGSSNTLHWGQSASHLGYYIGVLATEYWKLSQYGEDVTVTEREVYYALHSYIENMDKCEDKDPWYMPSSSFNGFFMRENVPVDFVTTHNTQLNYGDVINQTNVFNDGRPAMVNSLVSNSTDPNLSGRIKGEMSQDEAIGMLLGLSLTYKCFGSTTSIIKDENGNIITNESLGLTASTIARKIINKVWGSGTWVIYNPWLLGVPCSEGGCAIGMSYGFYRAYNYFPYFSFPSTISVGYIPFLIWQLSATGILGGSDRHMAATLAAIGNSWLGTVNGIQNNTEDDDWDSFYLLSDVTQNLN